MPDLLLPIVAILMGFGGLIWSADRFVEGSAAMAKAAGLSPLIIGLTVVSFGTSAPEILVSLNAALSGAGELAIGNAIGSNLANVGLVLGVTALVAALPIQKHLLTQEWPILMGVTLLAGLFLFDATLTKVEGIILLALLPPIIVYLIIIKQRTFTAAEILAEEDIPTMPPKIAAMWFVVGLALLIIASKILVWGATETAAFFGVSPLIIGLTVVAVGTSLPELAASVVSALKGHHDIALGNVIGSNLFNLMAVMPLPTLFAPLMMDTEVFARDFIAMLAITSALLVLTFIQFKRGKGLGKVTGLCLLAIYGAYYVYLF